MSDAGEVVGDDYSGPPAPVEAEGSTYTAPDQAATADDAAGKPTETSAVPAGEDGALEEVTTGDAPPADSAPAPAEGGDAPAPASGERPPAPFPRLYLGTLDPSTTEADLQPLLRTLVFVESIG